MLVLTRKIGEDILIGKDVRVVVVNARRNCVKLAFSAPHEVSILRGELRELARCAQQTAVMPCCSLSHVTDD
jgi:carbon storage regulator